MTPVERERAAMLREFIHERLGFIRGQAELAQGHCELGDDAGLVYMTKRVIAELKTGMSAFQELEEILIKSRRRHE
jgi:hypothetical protein